MTKKKLPQIFCLPGLGTDHRIFHALLPLLPFNQVVYLDFDEAKMLRAKGIEEYTDLLATELLTSNQIDPQNPPLLLGLSLGGFVATELSKRIPHKKLVLLSTIKHKRERPWVLNLGKILPLYKFSPSYFSRRLPAWIGWMIGILDKEGYVLYRKMLDCWSNRMFIWARHAAVQWENNDLPSDVIHIHGTRDQIFKYQRVQADYSIDKGSHYMVVDRAKEIASIIKEALELG